MLFSPLILPAAEPSLTGTGTLIIHLGDLNDNVPLLEVDKVNVCLSDKETMTNITAIDLDLPPYSAPFHYELLGDVKGKWRLEPNHGISFTVITIFHPSLGKPSTCHMDLWLQAFS